MKHLLAAALALLAVSCGPNLPAPAPVGAVEFRSAPRYLELDPGTSETFPVAAVAPGAPRGVTYAAEGLPSGITATVDGASVELRADAVAPGAYDAALVARAEYDDGTVRTARASLRLLVPTRGIVLQEGLRPRAVALDVDAAGSVEADVTGAGATIAWTDARGTAFSLTVPAGALTETRRLRLSPITTRNVAGATASFGLRIEPEEARFLRLATLTVRPVRPDAARGLFVGWRARADGAEFHFHEVRVADAVPTLAVRGGGATGIAWIDAEAVQDPPVPTSPEDRRLARLWRYFEPGEVRLTETTYFSGLNGRVAQATRGPERVDALLPELAAWDDDLRARPYAAAFAGNVGVLWMRLGDAAILLAEGARVPCTPDTAAAFRRWRLAADALPAWRQGLGEGGVRALDARLAACP